MAWADEKLFTYLKGLPSEAWMAKVSEDDWPVFGNTFHLIASADWYNFELGHPQLVTKEPESIEKLIELGDTWRGLNEVLIEESLKEDQLLTYVEDGQSFSVLRSSVLVQAVIHSVEHRVQILTALKLHGFEAPILDDFSQWGFIANTPKG